MNSTIPLAALLALSLIAAPLSHAQGNDRGRGEGREGAQNWGGDGGWDSKGRDNGRGNGRGKERKDRHEYGQRGGPGWSDEQSFRGNRQGPGAGRNHDFYRGDRLPYEYRHSSYVVDDWRGHQLSAPPRGYHWVQTGPDYVLIAIASGIIAQVLLGH